MEKPWFLGLLVLGLLVTVFFRKYFEKGPGAAALAGIGAGLGALMFAASLADRHETWWYGLIAGAAVALLASAVSRSLFGRVRARFASAGDSAAAAALPFYGEVAGAVVAGLSVLFPPLAILAIGFLIALWWTGRRRGEQKYAGLRILR